MAKHLEDLMLQVHYQVCYEVPYEAILEQISQCQS